MVNHVVLVDENDQEIGVEEKLKAHQKGLLHRAFSVFVFRKNKQIEVLLHKRNREKYHSGGLWTNACCSHPLLNRPLVDSARIRLIEEMGLDLALKRVGVFQYRADLGNGLIENEMDHIFTGWWDGERIEINLDEVESYRWVQVGLLLDEYEKTPEKFTAWFKEALQIALDAEGIHV
ncbi:isopentenyl-diphosphate Delta-isomerase [Chlamydiales bacterium]|nr:isopentenyl-diphosphate Delta-isomerase [Chlamydiales bacterium]